MVTSSGWAFRKIPNPAKASRKPTEKRTKPIKRRELKKAEREVEFVFIELFPLIFLLRKNLV
jgi:hypothetical protein